MTVEIDFVEFEDKTMLGDKSDGAKVIIQNREGAVKYKTWLIQKYTQSGKSIETVASLLKNHKVPDDLGFKFNSGSRMYQHHMLDVYIKKGATELEKYLNR